VTGTYHHHLKERYLKVRVGFVAQGTSLNAWCRSNGIFIQYVRDAFLGRWNGPAAEALRERVTVASGALSK
jgi:hypothetical protein